MLRWNAVDSAADTVAVVIDAKGRKLSFEVEPIPEQYLVQQLFANRSNHAFNEGMRTGHQGHSLDLFDLQDAQVGQPAMESEQGLVVRGWILRQRLLCPRAVEDPADDWTNDRKRFCGLQAIRQIESGRIHLVGASGEVVTGALLLEQNDEWSLQRRYMQLEGLQQLTVQ